MKKEVIVGNVIVDDDMVIGKVADVLAYTKDTMLECIDREEWTDVETCLDLIKDLSKELPDCYIRSWVTPMGTYTYKYLREGI